MSTHDETFNDSHSAPAKREYCEHTFEIKRERLLRALETPGANNDFLRRELDDLYIARRLHLDRSEHDPDGASSIDHSEATSVAELRKLIHAMMEDGLLRYSRRQRLLEEARSRGIDEFHAQLLIAQVQIGNDAPFLYSPSKRAAARNDSRLVRFTTMSLIAVATILIVSRQLT